METKPRLVESSCDLSAPQIGAQIGIMLVAYVVTSVIEVARTIARAFGRFGLMFISTVLTCMALLGLSWVLALVVVPPGLVLLVREYRKFKSKCWNLPWFGIAVSLVGGTSFMARYGYEAFPERILAATPLALVAWKKWKVQPIRITMMAAVALNAYAFCQFGMGFSFKGKLSEGVYPILTELKIPEVEALVVPAVQEAGVVPVAASGRSSNTAIFGPDPLEVFFSHLPGAPPLGEFEFSLRDAALSCDGTTVWVVCGQADRLDMMSAAIKFDLATGKPLKTLWMYTAFSVKCFKEYGLCTIVSEQGNRIYLIDDVNNEVIREYNLRGLMPSYQFQTGPDEVGFLLVQGSGVDKARVPSFVKNVVDVPGEYQEQVLLGFLSLATGEFQVKPVKGKPPEPFMGDERLFASYDEVHRQILFGSSLTAIDLDTMVLQRLGGGFRDFFAHGGITGGAVVDPDTGLLYANRTFGGLVEYTVSPDGEFQKVGRIPIKKGGRMLERDTRRGLLISANYGRGWTEVINPRTQVVVARWNVGKQLRNVHFYRGNRPEDDRLIAVSSSGVYMVYLAEALGEGTKWAGK